MARIISIDAYDILNKTTKIKYINIDNVIEVVELLPSGQSPLTRIRMTDGTLIDIEKDVKDVIEIINA